MTTQSRWTGGIRLYTDGFHAHLDPGPGALVRSVQAKLSPRRVRLVLITHAHPDHYTDAEVMIEAMTRGATKKRGTLIAPRGVLQGNEVCEAAISRYHQSLPAKVVQAEPGSSINVENVVTVTATKALHSDPDTIGYKLKFDYGEIGYTSDTQYFEGLGRQYEGVRVLILCTLRPRGAPWKYHMSTDDAIKIVQEAKPELAILTHFGGKMLAASPFKEARIVELETGVKAVASTDGMLLKLGEEIELSKLK